MKAALWMVGLLSMFGLFWLGRSAVDSDVVESSYASVQEARADQLFGRGWLPDILPTSTHSIRTFNNFDLNTSTGQFHFASADYGVFSSHLAPYVSIKTPFKGLDQTIQEKFARGF